MTLDRYRQLIPDWEAFVRTARAPEATTFRVGNRRSTGAVVSDLERRGFDIEPVVELDGFFRVRRAPFPVSKTLGHWLGDYYIQQAVTGVAAPALGARPGERILDLCAAPGGKTTHLADLMADSGIVVAADSDSNRLRALLANVYRLSHPNVLVVETDGRFFPAGALFDRVLVDVPCSAEGNVRRHGGEIRPRDPSFSAHIAAIQRALLSRALELVRPGGVVLYVTCTFAPEENEAVVDEVLGEDSWALEPIHLDLPHAPGLTAFDGRSYRDDLSLAWRIYPHHLDSGGLFLARIRRPADPSSGAESGRASGTGPGWEPGGDREGGPQDRGWFPVPERFPDPVGDGKDASEQGARKRIARGASGLETSFGLRMGPPELGSRTVGTAEDRGADPEGPEDPPAEGDRSPEGTGSEYGGFGWLERGDSVWVHRCPSWPVGAWDPEGDLRILSLGIRALKKDPRTSFGERPTSDLLRMMGDVLEQGVVELEGGEVLEILERRPVEIAEVDRGFVAMSFRGRILGRGWVKDGVLHNEISKARSRRLLRDLREEEGALTGSAEDSTE